MSANFAIPRFYPILDTAAISARGGDPVVVAQILLQCGVRLVQFRHKQDWTQREYDIAAEIAQLCKQAQAIFVINDRADFAHLLGVGVHLGQDDLPPVAARKVMGNQPVVGFSTHNRRQLAMGNDEPVQYLAIGPIFHTASKSKPDPVLGLEKLKPLRSVAKKPLVAIGGITLENAASVLDAGAASVAILSGFLAETCAFDAIEHRVGDWLRTTS